MVKGIAHVCFTVRDLERSVAFYVGALGLRPGFDFINEKGVRYGVYLCAGGRNFLELFEGEVGEAAARPAYRHLCLEVEDVAAAAETLRAKGVEVTPVKLGKDNSWQAWVADPDGNRIELHGYTPESLQTAALKRL